MTDNLGSCTSNQIQQQNNKFRIFRIQKNFKIPLPSLVRKSQCIFPDWLNDWDGLFINGNYLEFRDPTKFNHTSSYCIQPGMELFYAKRQNLIFNTFDVCLKSHSTEKLEARGQKAM